MLNNLIEDVEHCKFEGYHKKHLFSFKGHNSARKHSIIKIIKVICKMLTRLGTDLSKIIALENADNYRLGTDHSCKVCMKLHMQFLRSPDKMCDGGTDGQTDR